MPIPERLIPTFGTAWTSAPRPAGPDGRSAQAPDCGSSMCPMPSQRIVFGDQLKADCLWYKVGLELFIAAGPAVLEPLIGRGSSVFLDLKLHDIPNTVTGAVSSAAALGARMMTVHAAGGPSMLAAARDALEGMANPPELLAVTVLTSMDAAQLNSIGIERSPAGQVELLARVGLEAGIRGFVCAPQEVAALRSLAGPEAELVVPGIRPAGSAMGDQKACGHPG